ncbi:hypothetical protein J0S82_008145, partial [Galemys pyrenaicus]
FVRIITLRRRPRLVTWSPCICGPPKSGLLSGATMWLCRQNLQAGRPSFRTSSWHSMSGVRLGSHGSSHPWSWEKTLWISMLCVLPMQAIISVTSWRAIS